MTEEGHRGGNLVEFFELHEINSKRMIPPPRAKVGPELIVHALPVIGCVTIVSGSMFVMPKWMRIDSQSFFFRIFNN